MFPVRLMELIKHYVIHTFSNSSLNHNLIVSPLEFLSIKWFLPCLQIHSNALLLPGVLLTVAPHHDGTFGLKVCQH